MSYMVPGEIPKYCNACPFGHLHYALPNTPKGKVVLMDIDGQPMCGGDHGYVCDLDFLENGKYERVARSAYKENIKKPEWCLLIPTED